jgi:transcriptional regulator with XRE-family HTH domain
MFQMNDGVDVVVGRRLKARRRLLGITQQGLGEACGVTFQQIQKYEGAVSRISAHMLWKLACALEVDVGYFFSGLTREGPLEAEPMRPLLQVNARSF